MKVRALFSNKANADNTEVPRDWRTAAMVAGGGSWAQSLFLPRPEPRFYAKPKDECARVGAEVGEWVP
jgi:hypothetical protein